MSGLFHQTLSEIALGLGLAVEVFALALIPLVMLRRKEPSSTFAWILALVFLPGLGAVLFLLHGRDRVRWPARRKRAADAVLETRLANVRRQTRVDASTAVEGLDESEQRIFHVCRALGPLVEVSNGNKMELYSAGNAAQAAIEVAIDAAEKTVFVEYYLIRNDETGARFRDKLAAAAARGVDVRLLIDAYGCFWLSKRWFSPLRKAGAKVAQFLPLKMALTLPMNLRTHRKIVVVDGRVAFTGGLNVGDEYVRETSGRPMWRDTHVRVEGPAVASLTAVFLRDWHFMTGSQELEPRLFPEPGGPGHAVVAVVPSGPDEGREAIHRVFFSAIVGARRRAWITTPYFVPDRALLVALETAAGRGVEVKLLLPGHSNHRVTQQAGRSYYTELLEYGVEIFEYQPGMIHSKTMLVDDELSLVGSANMDVRSFRLNFEVHSLVHDRALAAELEATFLRDCEASRAIDLSRWRQRPWLERVGEGAARLVSPIL